MFRLWLVALVLVLVAGVAAAQEPKPTEASTPKSTASAGEEVTEVVTVHYSWWWVLAQRISMIAPVILLAIIAIVLFGIRSDLNRIAEQRGISPPPS